MSHKASSLLTNSDQNQQRHEHHKQPLRLHYQSPASEWSEALPIGNGRLGAMVHGRTQTELLQLNEDSVWYGGPQDRTPQDALHHLPKLRQLIRDEKHAEAESLVREAFFATPASMRHYEPLGTCTIDFGHPAAVEEGVEGHVTDYCRYLCLETAQTTVEYRHQGIRYRRDAIASFPDSVLAVRVSSSEPTRFVVRLNRVSEIEWETNEFLDSIHADSENGRNRIVLNATPGGRDSNRLSIALAVSCDDEVGSVEAIGNALVVHSAACTIVVGAQTTYRTEDPETAAIKDTLNALKHTWTTLVERHRQDFQNLFKQTSLQMSPDASHIATDKRIKEGRDPGLIALYHNYGRYLLISCSRSSKRAPLPATLQGIWNPSFAPPWGSKYTININLQMNYWPAGPCNLVVGCAVPVLDLLERMAERGKHTAWTMYGCRGWCAHHNTDIWADTDPQDRWMPSTIWPLGGVWLCIDMVEMLEFQYDEGLHRRAAAVLEGSVLFLVDFLIPSACGKFLVTNPSLSPENIFVSELGEAGIFCEGSVIDTTIVRMAFEKYLWSSNVLKTDARHGLRKKVEEALERIPPLKINDDGRIQEWGLKDYQEKDPGHRHMSHLIGLYPGDAISASRSPELAAAAKRVLERRAAHGGGHTGWSRAWLANLHARLWDGEGCRQHFDLLLEGSTLPNMLDNHPPFQIDGNFGGCAGILECLVQSTIISRPNVVEIRLLPSCPQGWTEGEVSGVRTKGGWLVSLQWRDGGIVESVSMESPACENSEARVVFPQGAQTVVHAKAPSSKHRLSGGEIGRK